MRPPTRSLLALAQFALRLVCSKGLGSQRGASDHVRSLRVVTCCEKAEALPASEDPFLFRCADVVSQATSIKEREPEASARSLPPAAAAVSWSLTTLQDLLPPTQRGKVSRCPSGTAECRGASASAPWYVRSRMRRIGATCTAATTHTFCKHTAAQQCCKIGGGSLHRRHLSVGNGVVLLRSDRSLGSP